MMQSVLLFGGASDERLVSVASAQNLAAQYDFSKIVFIQKNGALNWVSKADLLKHERPFEVEFNTDTSSFATSLVDGVIHFKDKCVFLALHGTEGEDGLIQKLFEQEKIAFTGSGAESSRVCFDKVLSKRALINSNIPMAAQYVFQKENQQKVFSDLNEFIKKHKKIVIKPVASGSSVGLQIVNNESELQNSLNRVWELSYDSFITESFVTGRELTVGVFVENSKLHALPPSEIVLNAGYSFDYQGKYLGKGTTEITPAKLTHEEVKQAQDLALRAHTVLKCEGYSRSDLILTNDEIIYLETNTLPGLSKASFIPQQLAAAQISLSDFVHNQLHLAIQRYMG